MMAFLPTTPVFTRSPTHSVATVPRAPSKWLCSATKPATGKPIAPAPNVPNTYASEPIPVAARSEIDRLLSTGDLFRYTAPENSPVSLLEEDFCKWIGSKYALAVSSCSAALFLSLKALDLPRDARVLIPAFTFAAVPSSVLHADCVPVLCEVTDNYRLDMAEFERTLDNDNISAVMISHMRGHTSDMDIIIRLCAERNIPVIEDAAHSLGTTWGGQNIGTLGKFGCFSFQSYKMLNAGEGGIMITDDPDLMARAVIMSGAYEHMWKKHPVLHTPFDHWQNKLPVYNLRMSNLCAAVLRPQIDEIDRRVRDGRFNYNYVTNLIKKSPWIDVPDKLVPEERAPDSVQFNLVGVSMEEGRSFQLAALDKGLKVEIFGLSKNNARAFWNWCFLPEQLELPKTRGMLMKACDFRVPANLTVDQLDSIAEVIVRSLKEVMGSKLM